MTGHIAHHLVRRGVEAAYNQLNKQQVSQLQQDAQLYENAGPEAEIKPSEMLPVVITAIIAALLLFSIDYTIGQVVASLAMIESPSRTAIIESPPPAYQDVADKPAEKEPLMAEEADVEVTIVDHKPITSKITASIGHLHRIGGFTARWRGLGLSIFYHFLHSLLANFLAAVMGFGHVGEALSYIFISVCLARLHMAWTHKMISYPSSKFWFHRLPSRKNCKALLLPSFVYATAQQLSILLPVLVAVALDYGEPMNEHVDAVMQHHNCHKMATLVFRIFAVPFTYLLVAVGILLPAAVTLTRVEAALLPEGEDTIVPFDKAAMMEGIVINARGGCRALFVQAWKSFDRSSRLRVIMLYVKMILAQATILFIMLHLIVAELYIIGGERIALLLKSGAAQVKLMAMEAHEAKAN